MKNSKIHNEKPKRRFCETTDGPIIRQFYATMQTTDLAEKLGLTVKQIVNYVYRHNTEPWARKRAALISKMNSAKGKKGGRPKKNSK